MDQHHSAPLGEKEVDAIRVDHITINPGATQRLYNPFLGVPRDRLLEEVNKFAIDNHLNDNVELLRKGALVAQSLHALHNIPELSARDCQAIEDEKKHRWRHPNILYFTIVMNSIAAAVQGWDQTGSNGANLSFPAALNIPESGPECESARTCTRNTWLVGLVNAGPYIAIAFL